MEPSLNGTPAQSSSACSNQKWHRQHVKHQYPVSVSNCPFCPNGKHIACLTAANLQRVLSEECSTCEENHVCRRDMWWWKGISHIEFGWPLRFWADVKEREEKLPWLISPAHIVSEEPRVWPRLVTYMHLARSVNRVLLQGHRSRASLHTCNKDLGRF